MATSSIKHTIVIDNKEDAKNFLKAITKSEEFSTYTVSLSNPCTHHTGWYGYVKTFWSRVLGTNGVRIYTCSLCGEILQGKKLKEFQNRKR